MNQFPIIKDPASSPCFLCRAWLPLVEDIAKKIYNRIWACHDCAARLLHGTQVR